jgi:uncharacterized repeat protein (TIGR02543 family)
VEICAAYTVYYRFCVIQLGKTKGERKRIVFRVPALSYRITDKKKFSVAFYNTLDYIIPIQQIPYGEIVVAPMLYKDGKTFKGWFYDDKFEKQFVQNSKMPPYNINLYAKWE